MQLYPLLFEPIYKEKVWGGRRLERLGRVLPGDSRTLIGESWEVADLASTAPSGGGGGAARSIVVNGALAGRSLGELMPRSQMKRFSTQPSFGMKRRQRNSSRSILRKPRSRIANRNSWCRRKLFVFWF